MKTRRYFIIFALTISIGAVFVFLYQQNNSNHTAPANADPQNTEIIEGEDPVIKIPLEGGKEFSFQLEDIPILQNYISGSSTPKLDIQRLTATSVIQDEHKQVILLHFSCGNKMCSHILVEKENEKITSINVEESSIFQTTKITDDQYYLGIKFGRNEGNINFNNIVLIDLKTFKVVPFQESNYLNYSYPILSYRFYDKSVILTIPDINKPTKEAIINWIESGKKDKKIKEVKVYLKKIE